MGLRIKLFLPLLLAIILLAAYTYTLWLPQVLADAENAYQHSVKTHLESVAEGLVPLVLGNQLDSVYGNLDALLEKNADWVSVKLLDPGGRLLYPLDASRLAKGDEGRDIRTLPQEVRYLDEKLGILEVEVDFSRRMNEIRERSILLICTFLAVLLLFLAATGFILDYLVRKPIRQLADASQRLANGDFGMPLPTPDNDEVGILINSFAGMRDAIRRDTERLFATNEELRREVAEREQLEQQLSRRIYHLDVMERVSRISLSSKSIEELLERVLEEILSVFNADRAWFLYPCDPDAPSWSVPMECTRPEWPGAFARGAVIPMTPDVAGVFRELLASANPLPYGPATSHDVPAAVAEEFSIRSQIQMALRPRVGSPWDMGLHHCAQAHVYSEDELLIFRDIGERVADALSSTIILKDLRESTRQLAAAQEELVRKEKLAILGQLSGSVGHELRNPLGVMSNAVYFLQMVLAEADETTREYLGIIKHEIDNSLRIITDLLDFARTRTPQRVVVTAGELVRQSLERCLLPEQVTVTVDVPDRFPVLNVDPLQMEQVLTNLITNAVQSMPEGGALRVAARQFAGDFIAIAVSDSGVGITPENMKKLFQPLFTTKAKGIGLGLVVCKNLVEANGGQIEVESELGLGTTFTVLLPLPDEPIHQEAR